MKKTILIASLAMCIMLAISCEVTTNYRTEGYGKMVVHNDAGSGKTITRIAFSGTNERVSIAPGRSSDEYKLGISEGGYGLVWSGHRVTITLDDNTTRSRDIYAYEDIVNHLYFNGTDLVER